MAPTGSAYFIDWVISNNSNVHVANHRDWFKFGTFVELDSYIGDAYGMCKNVAKVVGIGDVELQVKTSAEDNMGNKVVLKNVLYAPSIVTNIIGQPIFHDYDVVLGGGARGNKILEHGGGQLIGLLDFNVFWKPWLLNQPKGQTSLEGRNWMINAGWSDEERSRFVNRLQRVINSMIEPEDDVPSISSKNSQPPYTNDEKTWLRENWGGEYHFLRAQALSIHKEANRRELQRGWRPRSEQQRRDIDQFLDDLEIDPISHVADYIFDHEELKWIKKHYRHSGNFLISYGLKPFEDEDCKEGKQIVKSLMEDSDE